MTSKVDIAAVGSPQGRSRWWYLKIAAISALILANMCYFGGNAALDLWQVAGPGTSFTGTIVDHKHILLEGEQSDEYNVIVIDSNRGQLRFDVPDTIYNATDIGVPVSGVLDARGLFGHDEALRDLNVAGQPPLDSNTENRILGQLLILFVVLLVGGMVFAGIWRSIRGPRRRPRPQARGSHAAEAG